MLGNKLLLLGNYVYYGFIEVSPLTDCLTLCLPSTNDDGTILFSLWPLYCGYRWSGMVVSYLGIDCNGCFSYLMYFGCMKILVVHSSYIEIRLGYGYWIHAKMSHSGRLVYVWFGRLYGFC